jgi:hypothetical protein
MEFGTTELDSAFNDGEKIEGYDPEPGYYDTFKASVQNFTSVSLSSSKANYYKDERDVQKKAWVDANPKDEALYNRITAVDQSLIEKLDSMYESGDIEQIRNWHTSTDSSMVNISGIGIGTDYLKFRELQSSLGLTNTNDIVSNAQTKSKDDYYQSAEVLEKSDHWTAEALGSMWGALHDPVTIATLPLGTWKSGGTVLTNAGRATLEEMKIEAMAQSVIAPTVASYKQELEIKTTLAGEATNAAIAIGSAGLLRGAGSAAFDLTAKGMKALKVKDPELAADYEQMVKTQATEDTAEHINNLHKAEFDEAGVEEIATPNAKGEELNKAAPLVEDSPELVMKAQEATAQPKVDEVLQVKEPIETLDPETVQKYIGAKGEEQTTASAKLDEALQNVEGDYEGTAIGGMLDTEGTLAKLEVGDDYTTRGVTSIAKDKKTAETFVNRGWDKEAKGEKIYVNFESFINKPVNLGEGNKLGFDNVLDPKGGKYSFLEDEAVIPSGRKFEITKKEKIGDEIHYTVKEVDGPSQAAPVETVKAKKMPSRAGEISDAAQPKIGGSEEEAAEAVKNLFKKKLDADAEYRKMTHSDIAEYDRMYQEELKAVDNTRVKDPMDYEVAVGVDEAGDTITKSYRTMAEEVDLEAQYIAKAKECFL